MTEPEPLPPTQWAISFTASGEVGQGTASTTIAPEESA